MLLKDLANVYFGENLKVCVETGFNKCIEWEDVKALGEHFYGWEYKVGSIRKSPNYDLVISLMI